MEIEEFRIEDHLAFRDAAGDRFAMAAAGADSERLKVVVLTAVAGRLQNLAGAMESDLKC